MSAADRRFPTRWGLLAGPEWIQARHNHEMDCWWSGAVEAYVLAAWPSPEQIAINRRNRAEQRRQERKERLQHKKRMLKAQAIFDCSRSQSALQPQTSIAQLSLI